MDDKSPFHPLYGDGDFKEIKSLSLLTTPSRVPKPYAIREIFDPEHDKCCQEALLLYSQSFFPPSEPPQSQIHQLVLSHFYRVLVMENENQEVIACALVVELHEFNCYHIDYLCVRADQRGGGIGGKFFKQIADFLRSEQRYQMITLESETKMVGWYLKQGVLHLGIQSDQLEDEETGQMLRWWLLMVPLGEILNNTIANINQIHQQQQLTKDSTLKPLSSSSNSMSLINSGNSEYFIFNNTTGLITPFSVKELTLIVKGVKTLLLLASFIVKP